MNSKSCNSMRNMCRTCMTQFSETPMENAIIKKQSIYEIPTGFKKSSSIIELLQQLQPQIKVDCNNNIPTLMCIDCIQKLLVSHEFIETYKKVDAKLREIVNESKNFKGFEDSLKIVEEIDHNDKFLNKEPYANEITKNEYEIQDVNIKGIKKKVENQNNCPEYEDEMTDETEDLSFKNACSDASGSEWTPNEESDASDCEWTTNEEECQKEFLKSTPTQNQRRMIPKKIIVDEKELMQLPVGNEDGRVPCQECDAVLDSVKLWQEHMRQHRLGNIPKTKYTKKSNKPRRNLINKKFECEHCGKGFETTTTYRNHVRIHTGEEPYLCIECGKSFRGLGSLKIHMLRHKGEKTFQCPHCPKKFVCPSGLNKHVKIHINERPFVCDICGSAFRSAYELKIHDLYHKGIKNYQCEYCDKRFVSSEKQRRHMRTHTGEKPYRCKYCEKAFAQSNDYIKHLRQHLGHNVYQCDLCPRRFPLVRDLRAHFANHKDDDEETKARNLDARQEELRILETNLGVTD